MEETINQRIRRYRKKSNLTQSQLGEMIGLKTSTYSQMERKGQITCDTILRLAEVLKVDAAVLLLGEKTFENENTDDNTQAPPSLKIGKSITLELTIREYNLVDMFRHLSESKKRLASESIYNILNKRKKPYNNK